MTECKYCKETIEYTEVVRNDGCVYCVSDALDLIDQRRLQVILEDINRVEVIGKDGRELVRYLKDNEGVQALLQDNGKTLKLMIAYAKD